MKNQKPKSRDSIASIKRLIKYLASYKLAILFVIFASIVSAFATIIGPKLLGKMVEAVSKNFTIFNGIPKFSPDFAEISRIGFLLVFIYAISGIFGYLQNFIMAGISQKVTFRLREQLSQKIAKLPMNYFDKRKTGDIVSIITNDIEKIGESLSQSLSTVIYSSITLVGVSAMIISISWQISLIAFGSALLSVVLIGLITKFSQKYFNALQSSTGKINGHAEEMMSSHEIIKAYNGENDSIAKFKQINTEMYTASWRSQFFGGLIYPVMGFVGNLSTLTTVVFGGEQ